MILIRNLFHVTQIKVLSSRPTTTSGKYFDRLDTFRSSWDWKFDRTNEGIQSAGVQWRLSRNDHHLHVQTSGWLWSVCVSTCANCFASWNYQCNFGNRVQCEVCLKHWMRKELARVQFTPPSPSVPNDVTVWVRAKNFKILLKNVYKLTPSNYFFTRF